MTVYVVFHRHGLQPDDFEIIAIHASRDTAQESMKQSRKYDKTIHEGQYWIVKHTLRN